jgi:hypothetical protein
VRPTTVTVAVPAFTTTPGIGGDSVPASTCGVTQVGEPASAYPAGVLPPTAPATRQPTATATAGLHCERSMLVTPRIVVDVRFRTLAAEKFSIADPPWGRLARSADT